MNTQEIFSTKEPETTVVLKAPELGKYVVTITDAALMERKAAIETSQEIVKVDSPTERSDALAAVSMVKGLLKALEKTREEIKRPVLDAGQAIDRAAKSYSDALKIEQARVERLLNDYQAKCNAAAEALRREELAALAKENEAASAANDIDKLRENAARAAEISQRMKVEGAMMKQGLEYDILNALEAATAHPELFTIEPKRRELLAFINTPGFVSMPGVSTRLQVKVHAKAS